MDCTANSIGQSSALCQRVLPYHCNTPRGQPMCNFSGQPVFLLPPPVLPLIPTIDLAVPTLLISRIATCRSGCCTRAAKSYCTSAAASNCA
ncbi:hypothetical protein MRB53_013965 [Persea americana]|uniref:Uncharacterized protein n=1 Tax=Persea americana TaxID=3435 RepID=A0ACC2K9I3_PERAE|nr:hypothetical protein MRB53_013965 [Persea americana]